jgi:ribonuclease HI
MSALNLKNIIEEDSSTQLYTDGSKLQNGNTGAAALVIDEGQLAWENKTYLSN